MTVEWLFWIFAGLTLISGVMLCRGIYNGDWPTGYSDENKAAKERERH